MAVKSKYALVRSMPIWGPIVGIIVLVLIVKFLLKGVTAEVLTPKGLIATQQRRLLVRSVLLLLEIAIPTLTFFYYNAWKYRESNVKATYEPNIKHDKSLVFRIWALPTITMLLLAVLMWPAAHELAPQKALASPNPPLTIQVVALRWKWLFIYPDQKIATVNFVEIPTDTPVQFDITGDEVPMSSFWIPQLAGQLYAMTGHVNRLNVMAATPGDYAGSNAEINGPGFAEMKFTTRATSKQDFDEWAQNVTASPNVLDTATYQDLLKPTEKNDTAYYSQADPAVYAATLAKYSGSHGDHMMNMEMK